jgi:DNA-binding response OmpR family regulator
MSKRILVVDDDPMIRGLVKAIIEDVGYEAVLVEDGKLAVDLLEKEPRPIAFCLIILDMVMPGMNGLDVLTRLKLHPHTSSLPVLMLTGEDKADDIMAGYSVGADYYITKPFTRQQLMYGINLVLDQSRKESA